MARTSEAGTAFNTKSFLKDARGAWKKQKKAAKEAAKRRTIDDGRYVAMLTGYTIGVSRGKNPRPQLVWKWTILEGSEKGRTASDFDGMDGDRSWEFIGGKLMKLGVDLDDWDPSMLEETMDMLVHPKKGRPVCRITLRTKDGSDFQNLYIDQVLEDVGKNYTPEDGDYEEDDDQDGDEDEEDDDDSEDEEEDEDDDEPAELTVGADVEFAYKGKTLEGVVKKLNEKKGIVTIERGGKRYEIAADDVTLLEDDDEDEDDEDEEDEEEEEAPKSKKSGKSSGKKSPAKKPAKKGKSKR